MNQLIIPEGLKNTALEAITRAGLFEISSRDKLDKGVKMTVGLHKVRKYIEEEKEKRLHDAKEYIKKGNSIFNPVIDQIKESENLLKKKIALFKTELDKIALEERQERMKGVDPFDETPETALMAKVDNVNLEGMHLRSKKSVVITDASLVPKEYWIIDESKIKRDLRLGKKIPGVEIAEEKISVIR